MIQNNKTKVYNQRYYLGHREEIIKRVKQYTDNNQEEVRDRRRRFYLKNRERLLAARKEYQKTHREQIRNQRKSQIGHRREVDRARRLALKKEIVRAYGGACNCCGEQEVRFLTIDHINGGGRKHVREIRQKWFDGGSGNPLYRWLKINGFPKDEYQLLCYNCNCAKYIDGVCPHKVTTNGKG